MRSLKFAGIVAIVAFAAYAVSLSIVPPKKSVAAGPAKTLFSLEIAKLAKEAPQASYDAN